MLVEVRALYDNYAYIIEMTAQFIPDKLPTERISEFITAKKTKKADETADKAPKKEYQMFAPEFEHVTKLIEKGLKFKCE